MKKAKKLLLLLAMVLSLIVPANVPLLGTLETASAIVQLNYKQLTLTKGQSRKITVQGTTRSAKWSSNNKSVASVTQKGVVTGNRVGTAVITAKVLKKKYTCKVTIKNYTGLTKKAIRLEAGTSTSLRMKANWKSSDTKIAKVSKTGVIRAIRPGVCEVSATVNSYRYIYVIKVPGSIVVTSTPVPVPTIINTLTPSPVITNTPTPIWVVTNTPTPTPRPVITNTPTPAITNTPAPAQPQSYVWLSATGEKYHKIQKCGNMDPTRATRVTLEEAIQRGYPPCEKCF